MHVAWLVSKGLGDIWYGGPVSPSGKVDRYNISKGYHAERREVWLMPYTFPGLEELPPIRLAEFHESSDVGGMAYDGVTGRLYVHEGFPPDDTTEPGVYPKEKGRIHVYQVGADGAGEPEPEPEPEPMTDEVTIHIEDVGWYSGKMRFRPEEE